MKKLAQFIIVFVLCCAAILGAWLAGAIITGRAFAIAAAFSLVLVLIANTLPKQKQ